MLALMKKYIILLILITFTYAKYDPHTGIDIQKHLQHSLSAKFATNDYQREYSSFYSVLKDMQEYGIKEIKIYTLDAQSYEDITKVSLVYGSKIAPNFGKKSLLAYKIQTNAFLHVKNYGGKILSYEEVLEEEKKAFKTNGALMNNRYKKRAYPMGKKIFEKRCKDALEPTDFVEISDLKETLYEEKICGDLEEEHFDALALYLWNVKRKGDLGEVEGRVEVREDEKCPVCGMFTYKYPKWAAQIYYKHDDHEHRFSFDGVKDMMKFYFDPLRWGSYQTSVRQNITKILVTDYYSGIGIDGTTAFYVIRSDIYGPMGHELIPFSTMEDATTFKNEHRGTKILKFEEITEALAYELDTN